MDKKTILITGSTDGIGKMAATRLAAEGHNIFLHGRNNPKLTHVLNEIRDANQTMQVDGFIADLSDPSDVARMAQEIISRVPKIDVLINNAGVYMSQTPLDSDGIDLRFKVNYLAPFQLTETLMPVLENTSQARIINLSSAAQESVALEALEGRTQLSAQAAYAQSKLALTMWSFNLVYVIMEVVGDYSENPFQGMANDIPMMSLCRVNEIDLREMLGESDLPPSVASKDGILM